MVKMATLALSNLVLFCETCLTSFHTSLPLAPHFKPGIRSSPSQSPVLLFGSFMEEWCTVPGSLFRLCWHSPDHKKLQFS
ncbi:hypothetical protein BJ170DRAFT_628715 [Xylariales sp. AK1849]|nr:hypothetical protein BJ170DRAFT_628715 [Xylariales sp. AK1849]